MPFRALSRGLKRRLVLAAAMIHNPEILFLDEPTIGLDVPSARALRKHIKHINQKGTTIFLTTHNLAEAEDLADTVCILIKGQVVKVGSPEQISRQVQRGTYLKLGLSGDIEQEVLLTACPAVQNAKKENGLWRLKVDNLNQALKQSLELAESQNLAIKEVSVDRPNLEEAFLAYVENGGSSKEAGR
jgi:ABC-2 type transport system ATP-binding protein